MRLSIINSLSHCSCAILNFRKSIILSDLLNTYFDDYTYLVNFKLLSTIPKL